MAIIDVDSRELSSVMPALWFEGRLLLKEEVHLWTEPKYTLDHSSGQRLKEQLTGLGWVEVRFGTCRRVEECSFKVLRNEICVDRFVL